MVRSLAKIVLVITILLVAVPPSQAAEGRMEDRSGWGGFLADLWEVFSMALGDNGCWVDPNGTCRDSVQRENGCILDPNGDGGDSSWADNGCEMDPSGGRCGG